MYTRQGERKEATQGEVQKRDVIIATNIAGRGTDLKVAEGVVGGMHVMLTFLPSSIRVIEQNLGRTSRSGNFGTGQMILNAELLRSSGYSRDVIASFSDYKLQKQRDDKENESLEK